MPWCDTQRGDSFDAEAEREEDEEEGFAAKEGAASHWRDTGGHYLPGEGTDSSSEGEETSALLLGGRRPRRGGERSVPWTAKAGILMAALACVGLVVTVLRKQVTDRHGQRLHRLSKTLKKGNHQSPSAEVLATATIGLSTDSTFCAAHSRCKGHNSLVHCCPNVEGQWMSCCNMSKVPWFPPKYPLDFRDASLTSLEEPPISVDPAARPETSDFKKCGHIYCTQASICCEVEMPRGVRGGFGGANKTRGVQKYGICGAPGAKCCGRVVCSHDATCCHGLCLAPGTSCAGNISI